MGIPYAFCYIPYNASLGDWSHLNEKTPLIQKTNEKVKSSARLCLENLCLSFKRYCCCCCTSSDSSLRTEEAHE